MHTRICVTRAAILNCLLLVLFLASKPCDASESTGVLQATYRFPGAKDASHIPSLFYNAGYPYLLESGLEKAEWDALIHRLKEFRVERIFVSNNVGSAPDHGTVHAIATGITRKEIHALARASYHYYREVVTPQLRSKIEALEAAHTKSIHKLKNLEEAFSRRLASGDTVLHRHSALEASSGRAESLRSRVVDLRIEKSVLEAKIGAVTKRYANQKRQVIEAAELRFQTAIKNLEKSLAPGHPQLLNETLALTKEREDRIARSPETNRLRILVTDTEIELVLVEEELNAIQVAQEKERAWRASILSTSDDLAGAEERMRSKKNEVELFEANLKAYRNQLARLEKGEPTQVK